MNCLGSPKIQFVLLSKPKMATVDDYYRMLVTKFAPPLFVTNMVVASFTSLYVIITDSILSAPGKVTFHLIFHNSPSVTLLVIFIVGASEKIKWSHQKFKWLLKYEKITLDTFLTFVTFYFSVFYQIRQLNADFVSKTCCHQHILSPTGRFSFELFF